MSKDYFPPMHTAEHILNQTMIRMFNCGRSFSMHLEKKKSKCDYHFERNLSADEIKEIELRVNEVINSDFSVTEDFLSRSEADKIFNLDKLPDTAGETIRIINIGNYDSCPCIGNHVNSTKEVGSFRIISSSSENGILRIRYKLDNSTLG